MLVNIKYLSLTKYNKLRFYALSLGLSSALSLSFAAETNDVVVDAHVNDLGRSSMEIGGEEVHFNVKGYSPARLSLLESASPRALKKKFTATNIQINPNKITELPLIKDWTLDLVYNQGNLGSCTANSAAFTVRYLSMATSATPSVRIKTTTGTVLNPDMLSMSRLYQYYHTRSYEAKLNKIRFKPQDDTGASIIGSILALDKYGCCPEKGRIDGETISLFDLRGHMVDNGWDYNISQFHVQPDPDSYIHAFDKSITGLNDGTPFAPSAQSVNPYARIAKDLQYKDLSTVYRRASSSYVNTDNDKQNFRNGILYALESNHPVMMGTMLDDSFMNSRNGYFPTPALHGFTPTGGHAMSIVGYGPYNSAAPTKRYYKVINSWGNWGDKGFGYFEEDYLNNVNVFGVEAYEVWLKQK